MSEQECVFCGHDKRDHVEWEGCSFEKFGAYETYGCKCTSFRAKGDGMGGMMT